MQTNWIWLTLSTVLFTAAVVLMAVATVTSTHMLACWSLLVAMIGCSICVKLASEQVAVRERVRLEDLAAIMAREAVRAQAALRSV